MKRLIALLLVTALYAVALPHLFVRAQLQERGGQKQTALRQQETPDLDALVRRYERVRLDRTDAAERVRFAGQLSFTTSEQTYELELEPRDMRADNYYAVEVGADGVERAVAPGPVRTYKGTVRGMENAQARFTVDDGTFEGMIITPGERYFIEPRKKYSPTADDSEFVFYKSSDVNAEAAGVGGTLDYEVRHEAKALTQKVEAANMEVLPATTVRDVQLATDADGEFVAALGSAAAANAEILSIMNQVEGVYQSQTGITFTIVHQNAWASAATDPYTTNNPGGCYNNVICGPGATIVPKGILNEFGEWWSANKGGVQRDLAHLWTGKDVGGPAVGVVGLAWIGVVCAAPSYSYGFSQRIGSLAGKYVLTAHEIGHNFSADHSSGQAGCTGTIMEPFVGTNLSFCSFSINQIKAHAGANSACLASCTYAATPTTRTVAAAAGQYNFALTAGCAWTATSNQPWLTLAAGSADGTGSETIVYNVAANTASTSRTAVVTVNGEKHTVTQSGATVTTLSIQGRISVGLTGLAGVAVKLTGSKAVTVTTNSLGDYTFTGLPAGNYTVTPSKLGYAFTPVNKVFTNMTISQRGINFAARLQNYTISGRVIKSSLIAIVGVPGITVSLSGSRAVSVVTDANGNFSFANLPAGGNYTLRPSNALYNFSPISKAYTNLAASQTQNFTATQKTYAISGKITLPGVTTPISLVAVTISSPSPAGFTARTVNTSSVGGYTFTGLPAGRTYTVRPAKTGYTFTPTSRTFSNLMANQPVGALTNFTGTP